MFCKKIFPTDYARSVHNERSRFKEAVYDEKSRARVAKEVFLLKH